MKPILGLTIGDPAGVGPEIVLKTVAQLSSRYRFVVFGDKLFLEWVSRKVLKRAVLPKAEYRDLKNINRRHFRFGIGTAAGGKASGETILATIRAAQNNEINAVVTAPINKEELRRSGWPKQQIGHTEIFAHYTRAKRVALMLVCGNMRAVHVTSHIPISQVSKKLSTKRILETILLTHHGLRQLGIKKPRIAVCGLNPHAGERGVLGTEEKRIIHPAVLRARRRGVRCEGPLSADAVWPQVRDGIYDAGVAMYHDQGQIPVKLMGFRSTRRSVVVHGVNITLGLPIIRTSVAHGTAYDIAGKGIASQQSMVDAVKLAARMVERSKFGTSTGL